MINVLLFNLMIKESIDRYSKMSQQIKISQCTHQRIIKQSEKKLSIDSCLVCGSYLHSSHNKVIKSQRYDTTLHTSNYRYLKFLRKRSCPTLEKSKNLSQETFTMLDSICTKFDFGMQTLALGIYLYFRIYEQRRNLEKQKNNYSFSLDFSAQIPLTASQTYDTKNELNIQELRDEKFFSSVCLIIAGKAIELDRKVPYLDRYQRYADSSRSKKEYQNQEQKICSALNFDLQYSTFVTYLNFLLTKGVLFESDCLPETLVILFENQVLKKACQLLKNGQFVFLDQEQAAIEIIRKTRKQFGLQEMPKQLQLVLQTHKMKEITQKVQQQCRICPEQLSQLKTLLLEPLKQKKMSNNILSPLRINRSSTNSSQNSKSFEIKYIKMRARTRRDLQTHRPMSNIKQNSTFLACHPQSEMTQTENIFDCTARSLKLKQQQIYKYIQHTENAVLRKKQRNQLYETTIKSSFDLLTLANRKDSSTKDLEISFLSNFNLSMRNLGNRWNGYNRRR